MSRIARVAAYVLLISVGPFAALAFVPTTVCYRITESYVFEAQTSGVAVHLAVLLPRSGPYQAVENVVVQWPAEQSRYTEEAVDVYKLDGETGPDGRLETVLAYDVRLSQGRTRWHAPVLPQHLEPEPLIESDAPVLAAQADEIASERARETAYRAYRFTGQHLDWPRGTRFGTTDSALTAYETGLGVCAEHANLMTALCRAGGVPARSVSGLFLPLLQLPLTTQRRTWNHPGGSHAWVEVHTGQHWEMVDPTVATSLPIDRLWFGRSMGQHLSYGDSAVLDGIYQGAMHWAESQGDLIGAMSAPLRFAASAERTAVTVTPAASVKKSWDVRWLVGPGLYLAILLGALWLEGRLKRAGDKGQRKGQWKPGFWQKPGFLLARERLPVASETVLSTPAKEIYPATD